MSNVVKCKVLFIAIFSLAAVLTKASPAARQQNMSRETAVVSDSVYQVQQGDTFYSLSRRFNIPADSLQKWNGKQLLTGQELYLHRPGARQAAAGKTAVRANTSTKGAFPPSSTTASSTPNPKTAAYKTKSRIMVIPFDPYLYFSDADHEIAAHSHIQSPEVRYAFRNRLDAQLRLKDYETIHVLGDIYRDSVNELRSLYKTLHYSYQDNKQSRYNQQQAVVQIKKKETALEWAARQKEKLGISSPGSGTVSVAKDDKKHYGVEVKDSTFFDYFNNQYAIDYYVFINQFEVKTNYENCLDRASWDYERDFLVHYSIYSSKGELVSGNKIKVPYHSNINDINQIVSDNVPAMARRVLSDLPAAQK